MRKIQGHSDLHKTHNGAVINTDLGAYERAKKRKAEKNRMTMLENRLNKIEQLLERLLKDVD